MIINVVLFISLVMSQNFRINLYTKCIMKVNDILYCMGMLIMEISPVTLFYYKIEACCSSFPYNFKSKIYKLEFTSIFEQKMNSYSQYKCCLIQDVFIKLINADDFQTYTIKALLNCFNQVCRGSLVKIKMIPAINCMCMGLCFLILW